MAEIGFRTVWTHHDESGGDGLRAAMAQLPKFSPVVLLTEEPVVLLIVPV